MPILWPYAPALIWAAMLLSAALAAPPAGFGKLAWGASMTDVQRAYPVACETSTSAGELCSLAEDRIEGIEFNYFNFVFTSGPDGKPKLTGIRAQFDSTVFVQIRHLLTKRYGQPTRIARSRLATAARTTATDLYWNKGAQIALLEVVKLSSSGAMDGELRISAPK